MARLNDDEWLEFGNIVETLQAALKKSFNPVMFNWGP